MWRCSEEEKKHSSGRAPTAPVHVVVLISLQHQAYWACLLYRLPFIFNAVFENIAVLYALPTSSGSHHFATTWDLCPGQSSSIVNYMATCSTSICRGGGGGNIAAQPI